MYISACGSLVALFRVQIVMVNKEGSPIELPGHMEVNRQC